jgi:hypothetical protein
MEFLERKNLEGFLWFYLKKKKKITLKQYSKQYNSKNISRAWSFVSLFYNIQNYKSTIFMWMWFYNNFIYYNKIYYIIEMKK